MSEKWEKAFPWLLIFIIPCAYLLVNREWLFPEVWISDSYINHTFAYFYNIFDFQSDWYKVERTSWLIPLYFLRKLVGGYHLLMTWGLLVYVLLGSLYFLVLKELFNRKKAVYSLPFILVYPHLVSYNSGGGTYHNYIVTIYFLCSILFWLKGIREDKVDFRYVAISGFFVGSTLISSIIHLNLLLIFPVLEYYRSKRLSWKNTFLSLLGGGVAYLFWSGVNITFDRGWVSFSQRIYQLLLHTDPDHVFNSWYFGLETLFTFKIRYARYLGIFMAMFLTLCLQLFFHRREGIRNNLVRFFGVFCIALWFTWHFFGLQALYPPDFSYPLQVPVFLCFPLVFNDTFISSLERFKNGYGLIFLVLFSAGLFVVTISFFPIREWLLSINLNRGVSAIIIIWFALSLFVLSRTNRRGPFAVALASFVFFYGQFADQYKDIPYKRCQLHEEADNFVINMVETLRGLNKDPRRLFVFHSPQETLYVKRPGCHKELLKFGMMLHHVSYILGSRIFIQSGLEVLTQDNSLEIVDDQFFQRIYSSGGTVFISSKNTDFYYNGLETLANVKGFFFLKEKEIEYDVVGNKIKGVFFSLTRKPENFLEETPEKP